MVKLKEIDDNRKMAREIVLRLSKEDKISVEELVILVKLHTDVCELTDIVNYLGEESIKFAEKRKERN